jgi:hypothetical protein
MRNKAYIYKFKPWIPTYSLILGILQLLGFNLAGFLWVYWWLALKYDDGYQPKWMYRLHIFMTFGGLLMLIVVFTPLRQSAKINMLFYQINNPSLFLSLAVVFPIVIIYSIPLLGIKKEKIQNEVALSNSDSAGAKHE